jgi:hypothetical protein
MLVELDPARLERVVERMLHRKKLPEPSLSLYSERARERRKAYERKDFETYVGNVHFGLQDSGLGREDWSFQESAPARSPNPEPNVAYENHVLRTGDYLTIYGNKGAVLWEGTLKFYPDGKGYRHPLGVEEEYLLILFSDGCPAELRTPTLATAGETVRVNNTVFGGAQVREPVFKA